MSFLKTTPGRMRLINQLRGKVTLCSTPALRELAWAKINNPESLSARSHNTFRSTRSPLRTTSLRGQVRRGTHGPTHPTVRTVDTMNRRPTTDTLWRLRIRRDPVWWNPPPHVPTCTTAHEGQNFGRFPYRGQRPVRMQPRTTVRNGSPVRSYSRGHGRRIEPILVRS